MLARRLSCFRAVPSSVYDSPPPRVAEGPLREPPQGSRDLSQLGVRQLPRHGELKGLFGSHPKVLGTSPS